ncbi:unnamed protein product [Caenorhabditis brenneri]
MVGVPRFPLLHLPNDERIEVLRFMIPLQLIKISFLSKRAKEMVISRKFKAESINVFIGDKICIAPFYGHGIPYYMFYLSMEHEGDAPKKVKKPTHLYFSEYSHSKETTLTFEFRNDKFEIKNWMEHFHTIFHCKETGIVFNENASQFDFDSVYEHFKNPDELLMFGTGNVKYNNQVMKSYMPSKDIRVELEIFENQKVPRQLLTQNFGHFYGYGEHLRESFTLDDLLCTNSKQIVLMNILFSQKDINRFLKLWIFGSNPRLEQLTVHFFDREVPSPDALVEGIKHVSLPDDHMNIKVSFLSKRAKESVISRKFKAESVLVFVHDDISIAPFYARGVPFNRFYLFMEQADVGPKTVKKPTHINFSESVPDAFDFDSVYEHFKNPDKLFCDTGNDDYNNRVMKSLMPSKEMNVPLSIFENQRVPRNLLIQNFRNFEVSDEPFTFRESFTLDDLLCTNSKEILLFDILFSQKDMNRFFKLWISGANRRLERLTVHFDEREVPTYDALVKGIKHVSLPDDHIKYYIPYHRRDRHKVRGGKQIQRKDGTKGTVKIFDSHRTTKFVHLYVWHDHNSSVRDVADFYGCQF